MDLGLMIVAAVVLFGGGAIALGRLGIAGAGLIAGRAAVTYAGLTLAMQPLWRWRLAAVSPVIYLLAVSILGRGADISHPAPWAWIAADEGDLAAWALSFAVLLAGVIGYLVLPPRTAELDGE